MKKISFTYILNIIVVLNAVSLIATQEEIHYKATHTEINSEGAIKNTYEYEWLLHNKNPYNIAENTYDSIHFINREGAKDTKKNHKEKKPASSPYYMPRPLSTFTSSSNPVTRVPSFNGSIDDTLSLDPSTCRANKSGLTKIFKGICNHLTYYKRIDKKKPRKRNPKDELPDTPSFESNHIYERVIHSSEANRELPTKHAVTPISVECVYHQR